jgi:anti-sigma regulatory factor (Ser/Thr protein kinase)
MGPLTTSKAPPDHVVQSVTTTRPENQREVSRTFAAHANSPRAARRFVVDVLGGWADDELLADAALVATELATNALVHARSEFTVTIVSLERCVRICVRDAAPNQWVEREASLMASHGRGLELVAALTNAWGQRAADGGKVVWAELEARRGSSTEGGAKA